MNPINFKKKIMLAGVVTIFAFLVTIGSTYAWFTTGQSSEIQSIEMSVQTDTSLLILLDKGYNYGVPADKTFLDNPTNYFSTLSNDMITSYYNYNNITFQPITTLNGQAFYFRDLLTSANSTPNATLDLQGQYIQFSVWLLSQDNTVNVAMSDFVVSAQSGSNSLQSVIVDATRLSLTAEDGTPVAQIYGLDKDYAFEFMPGETGYSSTIANNTIIPGNKTAVEAFHSVYYRSSGAVLNESVSSLLAATTVVALTANIPTKVIIRVWIEGWDADCTNNVLGIDFSLGFNFTIKQ